MNFKCERCFGYYPRHYMRIFHNWFSCESCIKKMVDQAIEEKEKLGSNLGLSTVPDDDGEDKQ